MKALFSLAAITFKEGIRSRTVYGILIFAIFLMFLNVMISGMMMQDVAKVAVDMALSSLNFVGLLLVFFAGVNLFSKDIERKTIYMVLARPISRSRYILGKFAGISAIIVFSLAILAIFESASIVIMKNGYPAQFLRFSWSALFFSFLLTLISLIVVLSTGFLFASFSSTSFITLVLSIVTYLIGSSANEVKALLEVPHDIGERTSPLLLYCVKAACYIFPNLSLFDIKTEAAHGLFVPLSYILSSIFYGILYSFVMLSLSCIIFKRREFP